MKESKEVVEKEVKSTLADNPALTIELVRELIFCVDSLVLELDDSTERFNVYNILSLLCNFTGNQALARYYQLCADYIYNVEVLMTEPYHTRFFGSEHTKVPRSAEEDGAHGYKPLWPQSETVPAGDTGDADVV